MKAPCEIIVWYILPSIRSELVKELVKRGMSRREVSERLEITQAAVSQYLANKRGHDVTLGQETKKAINKLAQDIIENNAPESLSAQVCDICKLTTGEKSICEICDMIKGEKPICKQIERSH
ncbi:MAG: transcriptional regulator [Candidatus Altiarchaeales archaeon]|nr:MAG: transcriptional regulator [Candidatus Altiarchaeales archaeon]